MGVCVAVHLRVCVRDCVCVFVSVTGYSVSVWVWSVYVTCVYFPVSYVGLFVCLCVVCVSLSACVYATRSVVSAEGWGRGAHCFLRLLQVSLAPPYSLPGKLTPPSFHFQVEAVIHPRFLEELLSPDPQMDFLALSQELEQEEGLTLAQVEQGGGGTPVPWGQEEPRHTSPTRLLPLPCGGCSASWKATPRWGGAEEPGRGVRMPTAVRPSGMPDRATPSVFHRKPSCLRLPCLPPKCLGLHHPGPCSHLGNSQKMPLFLPQVAEKRLQSLEEERSKRAAPSHGATQLDSSSSKSEAGQGADRDVPGPQQRVSMETCPAQMAARDPQGQGRVCIRVARSKNPVVLLERLNSRMLRAARPNSPLQDHRPTTEMASRDPQGRGRVCTGMARSINPVVLLERLDSRWLSAARPDSPPQDQRPTCPDVGTQDTWGLPGASPVKESRRLSKGSSEEREIPGMVSVVGTDYRLRPWKLSQSPVPASGLLSPEGRGPQGALQSQSAKRRGLSPAPAPTTKSKKRALSRGPSPAVQTPHLRPGLRVSGAQSLAWGLGNPSQSRKRK
ncbi:hypothetical protein P7K49_041024, partial [Saguinus oedipus]